jgi:hypothetical protein
VLVMEVAQVGAMFKLGLEVGVVKSGCSTRGVQIGVSRSSVLNPWFPSFDGVCLPTTSR